MAAVAAMASPTTISARGVAGATSTAIEATTAIGEEEEEDTTNAAVVAGGVAEGGVAIMAGGVAVEIRLGIIMANKGEATEGVVVVVVVGGRGGTCGTTVVTPWRTF